MKKRKILVIIGSESDLFNKKTNESQMVAGLTCLSEFQKQGKAEVIGVQIASIHRNHNEVIDLLNNLFYLSEEHQPDVIIAGAGWAAALPGAIDAYLRHSLGLDKIHVIGVAFEDYENTQHTMAARLSLSELPPGNTLICTDETGDTLTGGKGFLKACFMAVTAELPQIKLPKPRTAKALTLDEALNIAEPQTKES